MPRLPLDSLAFRLIAGAALWSVVALAAGGVVLASIFRHTVEESFERRMLLDLDTLITAAEPGAGGGIAVDFQLVDPRYSRLFSGWYWRIDADGGAAGTPAEQRSSRSLWDHELDLGALVRGEGGVFKGEAAGPDGQLLHAIARDVSFVGEAAGPAQGEPRLWRFTVAADIAEREAEIAVFNQVLAWSFGVLGIGLIAAILIQVRLGLSPLTRVRDGLAAVRDGRARRLEGRFPAEIAPLAAELNTLIDHSEGVVARARTHVGNLAHALKTPLTVLANEAGVTGAVPAPAVRAQVELMRRQVDHHLGRARAAGAAAVLGQRVEVRPVLDDLARVIARMHGARGVAIALEAEPGLAFRGEREDLDEMAGNLMDNACKWAAGAVRVRARRAARGRMALSVEDDGPGIPEADRAEALSRGARLDESVPGSGLGLSIVRDLAALYGGALSLGESDLGGLKAELDLPLAP